MPGPAGPVGPQPASKKKLANSGSEILEAKVIAGQGPSFLRPRKTLDRARGTLWRIARLCDRRSIG
jgi:hypothetical protein